MNKSINKALFCIITVISLLTNCSHRKEEHTELFFSRAISDTVSAYLEWVDSIPNKYHLPTITLLEFTESNGTDYMFLSSFPGWGGQSFSPDSKKFAYGRFHGKLLYIVGNEKFRNWGRWNLLRLTPKDKRQERYLSSHHLEDMVEYNCSEVYDFYTSFSEYCIITKDSLSLVNKSSANATQSCRKP